MHQMFSNATVAWNELDIIRRESLIREIPALLLSVWRELNPVVQMERCETPIVTPPEYLQSHIDEKFELLSVGKRGYLRPETTVGTYEALKHRFPMEAQRKKRLPYCMWQVGLSFRDEKTSETMRASKLRLIQFYQMEFQLFAAENTGAQYHTVAGQALVQRFGGTLVKATELPHYSADTVDWMMGDLEVAGLSVRKDWPGGKVYEVAIGLDRLVAMLNVAQPEGALT